ncbi:MULTISPECIES: hypothetical protein [Clostridium]|jgi:hypothetical protein|uniref:hypothetical protein n=1 Tax=Clostridium TaxID=1485 RepID=UPI000E8130DC|nr:hypothetical protein [Clostridium tyrobutyricum]HBF78254.1 hypothetical protein [Clostridiaceae bacterium]
MDKVKVILNEQHQLMGEQKQILDKKFPEGWEIISVPATGWMLKEVNKAAEELRGQTVVFASPIPALIEKLSFQQGSEWGRFFETGVECETNTHVFVFHNDKREKKELPGGKVIQVVASTGWQLV